MVGQENDKREIERLKSEIERLNGTIHSLNEIVWENNFKQQFFSYYASILNNTDQSEHENKAASNAEIEALTNKINDLQEQISNLCQREASFLNEIEKLRCFIQQQDLERTGTTAHVELLEKKLISFETTLKDTRNLKADVEQKLQQKQQEVDDLKLQILNSSTDFQEQLSNINEKYSKLLKSNDELQHELLFQQENSSRLSQELLTLQNESRVLFQSKEEENKQIIANITHERDSMVFQYNQVQEQFLTYKEESSKTISDLQIEVSALSDEAQQAKQEYEQLLLSVNKQNKELEHQNETLLSLQEHGHNLEMQLEQIQQAHDDAIRTVDEKEKQIEDHIKTNSELYSKNEMLQETILDLKNKMDTTADEIVQLNKQLQQKELDYKNEIISLQSTIVKLSTQMSSKLDQLSSLSARNENDELKKELLDKIDILKKEIETQQVIIEKLNAEARLLNQRLTELQDKHDNNIEMLESKNSEFDAIKTQYDQLTLESAGLVEERTSLEQSLQAKETELQNLRLEVEALKNKSDLSVEEETALKAANSTLNDSISKLNSDLRTIKSSLKEKIVELEKSNELKETLIQENKKLNVHYLNLKKLEQENIKIQSEKDRLQEEHSQMKAQLEEAQSQLANKEVSNESSSDIKDMKYELELLREEQKLNKGEISKKDIEILNLKTIIEKYKSSTVTNSNNNTKESKLEAPKQEPNTSKSNGKKKEKAAQSIGSQEASQVEFSQPSNRNSKNKRKLDKVETVDKDNAIDVHSKSPPKKHKTEKKFVIAFSNRSAEEKTKFKEIITQLGGTVIEDTGKYDARTTHLLTVVGSSTVKTIGASLSCKWIIRKPEEWLEESKKQGHFVDESPYGKRNSESPLKNKKICLLTSANKANQAKSAVEIIKEFGNCSFITVDHVAEADIVVLWDEEKPPNVSEEAECIHWDNFLKLVHNDC